MASISISSIEDFNESLNKIEDCATQIELQFSEASEYDVSNENIERLENVVKIHKELLDILQDEKIIKQAKKSRRAVGAVLIALQQKEYEIYLEKLEDAPLALRDTYKLLEKNYNQIIGMFP